MKIETLKVFIGHSFILSYTTTLLLSFLLSTLLLAALLRLAFDFMRRSFPQVHLVWLKNTLSHPYFFHSLMSGYHGPGETNGKKGIRKRRRSSRTLSSLIVFSSQFIIMQVYL